MGVEKLAQREFAEIASRQEALQTIFPNLLDIFYHPIFAFFQENRLFQHPPLFATVIRKVRLAYIPSGLLPGSPSSYSNRPHLLILVTWKVHATEQIGKARV